MSRKRRFPVYGRFDEASRTQQGTVVIEEAVSIRGTEFLFSVRPKRRRRMYTLPLDTVAQIVVHKIIKAELAEKRAAKRKRRVR